MAVCDPAPSPARYAPIPLATAQTVPATSRSFAAAAITGEYTTVLSPRCIWRTDSTSSASRSRLASYLANCAYVIGCFPFVFNDFFNGITQLLQSTGLERIYLALGIHKQQHQLTQVRMLRDEGGKSAALVLAPIRRPELAEQRGFYDGQHGEVYSLGVVLYVYCTLRFAWCFQGVLRRRWQEVVTGQHRLAGLALQLIAGLAGDAATSFGRRLVLRHAGGIHAFRNLPGGQFRQGGKNQLGLAHVVAQVVAGQALHSLVLRHTHARPLLVNDVGQDCNLAAIFDIVLAPIIGELVARFLPGHALLNPLVAAAVLLPGLASPVNGQGGVRHLLHALVTHLGQPELDGLGFGAGDGLD